MKILKLVTPQQDNMNTQVTPESPMDLANFSLCQSPSSEIVNQAVELQKKCHPYIPHSSMFTPDDVKDHLLRCPDGCWFVVHEPTNRLVGMQLGFTTNFNLSNYQHVKKQFLGKTGTYAHNPEGRYYYLSELSIDPEFKGLGFTKLMFMLTRNHINKNGLYGSITGAQFSNYLDSSESLSPGMYLECLRKSELSDETLDLMMRNDYKPLGIINNYHPNLSSMNTGVFMVWYGDVMAERNWEAFV